MPGYFIDDNNEFVTSFFYPEVVISEAITSTADVTEHPVEGQESINDHAQKKSETATIVMVISETPLPREPLGLIEFAYEDENGILIIEPAEVSTEKRPVAAHNWLRARRGLRLKYISTKFPELNDWVITSISTTRTNRRSLTITVSMKEVRVASARTVSLPPRRIRPKKAENKKDKGNQNTTAAPVDKSADSVLKFLADGLRFNVNTDRGQDPAKSARKVETPTTSSPDATKAGAATATATN